MSRPFPLLVAFDLDGTIWGGWMNEYDLGRGGWVTDRWHKEDNLQLQPDGMTIRDKRNLAGFKCRVATDFPAIVYDVLRNGGRIAIASRNTNKNLTNRALSFIQVEDPRDGRPKPFTNYITYNEVFDKSKLEHFQLFRDWSKKTYHQMVLFDDQNANKDVELWKGVTFQKVKDPSAGITWHEYCKGIDQWRRYNALRIPVPTRYDTVYEPYFVGFVGTDVPNAERYARGLRRLPTTRSARWGYGLYVTDDPNIAIFFSSNERSDVEANLRIVALYARDRSAFMAMNKVIIFSSSWPDHVCVNIIQNIKCWVPEEGKFHQIDNENLSFGETCDDNDALDWKVWQEFGYHKPYLLFTRHHYMDGMHFLKNLERFNEMVIYPQAQDAMFFGKVFTIDEAKAQMRSRSWRHRSYHHHIRSWNIKMHRDAQNELFNTEMIGSHGHVEQWKVLEDPTDFY
ncbi:acid phosphatase-domain-containing protein [Xylaria venustula]|nr:acid phosphatase-domain-containing protein [Xylaria venustula]